MLHVLAHAAKAWDPELQLRRLHPGKNELFPQQFEQACLEMAGAAGTSPGHPHSNLPLQEHSNMASGEHGVWLTHCSQVSQGAQQVELIMQLQLQEQAPSPYQAFRPSF